MIKDIYFADPEFLLILIVVPLAIYFWFKFGKLTQATLKYSSLSSNKIQSS